jgi:VWFA-related protein
MALMMLIVCSGLVIAAQETSNAGAAQNEPGFTIRSQSNLVLLRVIVRDVQGKPVSGLTRSHFEVYDNKKLQVISHFSVDTAEAPNPVPVEASSANDAKPVDPASQRFVALFFDDYHLNLGDLGQIRDAARRYLEKNVESGARVALFSASGNVRVEFTSERAKLEEALAHLQYDLRNVPAGEQCLQLTDYEAQAIVKNGAAAAQAPTVDPSTGDVPGAIDEGALAVAVAIMSAAARHCDPGDLFSRASYIVTENEQRATATLTALENLVTRIAETPGERVIAMVSDGFLDKSVQRRMDALIDRALRANVVINAMDTRGLFTPAGAMADLELSRFPRLQSAYQSLEVTSAGVEADALAKAAEGTGGTFVKNSNDFDGGLQQIGSPHPIGYVLGFSPANLKSDGQFHKLQVKLLHATRFTLQARRGYFAPNGPEDASAAKDTVAKETMERALFSRENMKGLPVQISTKFVKVDEHTTQLNVAVDVDMQSVRFRKEGGRNLDELTLAVALFDQAGNYVTGKDQTIKLRLTDAELASLRRTGGEGAIEVSLKPGNYVVRAVVRENESEQLGATTQNMQIP